MMNEQFKQAVRSKIQSISGDHMRVQFSNRGGKLYCKVIDPKSDRYSFELRQTVESCLKEQSACKVSITSGGGGHMTFRFEMETIIS